MRRRLRAIGNAERGVLAIVSGTGVGQLLAYIGFPILMHLYTPAEYGGFVLIQALAVPLAILLTMRLELAVPLPLDDATARLLVRIGLLATLALGAASMLLLGALSLLATSQSAAFPEWLLWVPPAAMSIAGLQIFTAMAIRQSRYLAIGRRNMVQIGGTLGLQLLAGWLGYSVAGLTMSYIAGYVLAAASLAHGSGVLARAEGLDGSRKVLGRYRRFSTSLAPAGLLNSLSLWAPAVLLGVWYSASDAGAFGLAQRLIAVPMALIGQAVAQVYLSQLSEYRRSQQGDTRVLFFTTSRRLASFAIVGALGCLILAPWLLPSLFGETWAPAVPFVQLLSIALAAQLIASPLSQTLIVHERYRTQLFFDLARLILIVVAVGAARTLDLSAIAATGIYSLTVSISYVAIWELSRRALFAEAKDRK